MEVAPANFGGLFYWRIMTLFDESLTPETIQLINENSGMLNKHLDKWIKNQKSIDSGIAKRVIELLSVVKRRHFNSQKSLSCTVERKRMIDKLVSRGHTFEEFRGVIEWIVPEWHGTMYQDNLYPETIFAAKHFQKYLEKAREAWLEKNPKQQVKQPVSNGQRNQYETLLIEKE